MSATPINLINVAELFARDLQKDADDPDVRAIIAGPILDGVKTVTGSAVDIGERLKAFLADHGYAVVKAN